jgi:type IV secretion system protein VirB9
MLKKLVCALLITTFTAAPVLAEQDPVGQKADVRIKKYVYDENNVYNLDLFLKSVTAIQFSADEVIQSILIGDSASWEVVKLRAGNVISIKPVLDDALTNMTVYTDQRVYSFELRAVGEMVSGSRQGAGQSFRAVFSYPESADKGSDVFTPGPKNADYLVTGPRTFRPTAIYDNGYQTTFVLAKGSPRPAIFKVGEKGKEKLVNSRTDGDKITVDGTADYWVMRIGDDRICAARTDAVKPKHKIKKGFWK